MPKRPCKGAEDENIKCPRFHPVNLRENVVMHGGEADSRREGRLVEIHGEKLRQNPFRLRTRNTQRRAAMGKVDQARLLRIQRPV